LYDIVAAVDGPEVTVYQQKVHTAVVKQIAANLQTLLESSRKLKVRSIVQAHYGIEALVKVQMVGEQRRGYISTAELAQQIIRQQNEAEALHCNAASHCQQNSLIFHFSASSTNESFQWRIVNDPAKADWEQASGARGFMGGANACFISLPLQDIHQYDTVDADAIYNATALGVNCIRRLHSSPASGVLSNTLGSDASSEITISGAEAATHRLADLVSTAQRTVQQLDSLIALFGYREGPWAFVTMSMRHRLDLTHMMSQLNEVRQLIASAGTTSAARGSCANQGQGQGQDSTVCAPDIALLTQIETLVYSAAETMAGLLSDPSGAKTEPAPVEQHFAVYGPYWLPLLVPALRGLRLAFSPPKALA
jgi:hypothetical protein